jgi:hypothetical protein
MRRFLGLLARPFLKIPPIRRWYLGRLLTYLEETPTSKLPDEMRAVQALLKRLPRQQRLAALETGLKQGSSLEAAAPQSRALRRAAEREARRRR